MTTIEQIKALVARVEFWLSTIITVITLLGVTNDFLYPEPHDSFYLLAPGDAMELYFLEMARVLSIYASFIIMNFYVTPSLFERQTAVKNVVLTILCYAIMSAAFKSLDLALAPFFIFTVYSTLKYGTYFLLTHPRTTRLKERIKAPGVLLAVVLWLISLFLFIIGDAEQEVTVVWGLLIPSGIAYYVYSFNVLIPKTVASKRPLISYIFRSILTVGIGSFMLAMMILFLTNQEDFGQGVGLSSFFFHLFITVPASWIVYKRHHREKAELVSLKKELNQSTASFDFLRSQINPHFLFNALNTLYGTALQENADRTAEGVQRLGDMMRFMLHENLQEKISLSREIEYLQNYIALQRLRTDAIPAVTIHVRVPNIDSQLQISPMLLIPFVENAFKHGISFREASHIKVSLELIGNELHFDVYNSNHPKNDNDPERFKSGVGLENVKGRLALLYPQRHELTIRETTAEYFIHLTIKLS